MFSVPISVVLLVFFVSQALGQTSSTVNLNVSPSPSSAVVSSSSLSNLATTTSSTTPTEPTTKTSEEPTTPSDKTCAKLSVVIDKPWNDTYKNNASENFRNLSDAFSSALKELFIDPEKYTNVEVSEVQFTEEKGKVLASAKLCLLFKGGVEVFIEDVFKKLVETEELGTDLPVKNDSAEFEPLGVSFNKDWTAKEGECEKKCEGTVGPFLVVRECEPETGFSCDGLKEPTEETKECTKYCSSTVAVSVSFVILMIGIFLSSSFQ